MMSMSWPLGITAVLALCSIGADAERVEAAELKSETVAAFDRYVSLTTARMDGELGSVDRFLWLSAQPEPARANGFERLRRGEVLVERLTTTDRGRAIAIPSGLVHHWVGLAFLPGVTLERAVALLQDYDRHASIYAPRITRSTLRRRAGDS